MVRNESLFRVSSRAEWHRISCSSSSLLKGYRSASLLILVCDDIIVLSYVAIIAILKSVTVVLVESIDFSCCFLLFYALDLGDLCLQGVKAR